MLVLACRARAAQAQDNAIESITANQQGSNVVVNIAMKNAPTKLPIGFSITNPTRIALDFGATVNATGKNSQDVNLGDLRAINVVQAGERTRLVFNLRARSTTPPRSTASRWWSRSKARAASPRRSTRVGMPVDTGARAGRPPGPARHGFQARRERRRPHRGRPAEQPGGGRRAPGRQHGAGRLHEDRPAAEPAPPPRRDRLRHPGGADHHRAAGRQRAHDDRSAAACGNRPSTRATPSW